MPKWSTTPSGFSFYSDAHAKEGFFMRPGNAAATKHAGGLTALGLAFVVFAGSAALACPICGQPTITLPERLARADVALLVEWVSAQSAQGTAAESTTYEIVQ